MLDYGLTNDEMNKSIQESHDYMINFGRKKWVEEKKFLKKQT
jgi:hypothetical protein